MKSTTPLEPRDGSRTFLDLNGIEDLNPFRDIVRTPPADLDLCVVDVVVSPCVCIPLQSLVLIHTYIYTQYVSRKPEKESCVRAKSLKLFWVLFSDDLGMDFIVGIEESGEDIAYSLGLWGKRLKGRWERERSSLVGVLSAFVKI